MTIDRRQRRRIRLARQRLEETAQHFIRTVGRRQRRDERVQVVGLHRMGRKAAPQRIAGSDAVSGQREIHAVAAEPGQDMTAADIGKEPDADLRHGELGVLRQDTVRTVEGDADAAAHDDPVDERDIGLAITLDAGVHAVFVGKEAGGRFGAGPACLVDLHDVAAGAEGPALSFDEHQRDRVVPFPGVESPGERPDHIVRQRVERLGTRERDDAGPADALEADVVSAAKIHQRSPSPPAQKC